MATGSGPRKEQLLGQGSNVPTRCPLCGLLAAAQDLSRLQDLCLHVTFAATCSAARGPREGAAIWQGRGTDPHSQPEAGRWASRSPVPQL